MADPLSVSSALLAIITAAAQSSKALYDTVESFKNHQRAITQLTDELKALRGVLESLQAMADQDDGSFQSLKFPLLQCHLACTEFEALIISCSKHSTKSRTSFRDWAKLRYMDGDINQFTSMLAGYKSTIAIAVADANLRSTTVTLRVLNEYKDMIQSTAQDLEDHLEVITNKLQSLSTENMAPPPNLPRNIADQQRIQNEKDCTEQCLVICENVLAHISEMRLLPMPSDNSSRDTTACATPSLQELRQAHIITLSALTECSDRLYTAVSHLKAHSRETQEQLQRIGSRPPFSSELSTEEEAQRLETERISVKQCLAICTDASEKAYSGRVHTLEDVTMGDGGQQIFVSTLGDLFKLKGVSAGDGAIQFVGSVSDETLQHYFNYHQNK